MMANILIWGAIFVFGVLVGGGAVSQLDFLARDCPDLPPRREAPVGDPLPDRSEERAAAIIADAKQTAANIEANALAQATAVAGREVIEASDLLREAGETLAAAQEAEIAAHRRAAAVRASACPRP